MILAGFSALFSVLSPLLVGIASVRTPGGRRLGWYSVVSGIIILLSGGLTAAAAANQFHYFGLLERVTIGTFIAWVFVYAAWLWSSREQRLRTNVSTSETGSSCRSASLCGMAPFFFGRMGPMLRETARWLATSLPLILRNWKLIQRLLG